MLTSINNQECISDMYIEENECFNEIITINLEDKNYRAGHFALIGINYFNYRYDS